MEQPDDQRKLLSDPWKHCVRFWLSSSDFLVLARVLIIPCTFNTTNFFAEESFHLRWAWYQIHIDNLNTHIDSVNTVVPMILLLEALKGNTGIRSDYLFFQFHFLTAIIAWKSIIIRKVKDVIWFTRALCKCFLIVTPACHERLTVMLLPKLIYNLSPLPGLLVVGIITG